MITNNLNIDVNELREFCAETVLKDKYQSTCYLETVYGENQMEGIKENMHGMISPGSVLGLDMQLIVPYVMKQMVPHV